MAWYFDNTAFEYMYNNDPYVTFGAYPITMAAWFNPAGVTQAYTLVSFGERVSLGDYIQLQAAGSASGDPIRIIVQQNGTLRRASTSSGFSAGSWQHAAGVIETDSSARVYLNGGSEGTVASTRAWPAGLDSLGVGALLRNTPSNYMNGALAEVAIWSASLTQTEIGALAKGVSPALIRTESLYEYIPLVFQSSPEKSIVRSTLLTHSSSPFIYPHPKVFYPRLTMHRASGATAAASTARSFSVVIA